MKNNYFNLLLLVLLVIVSGLLYGEILFADDSTATNTYSSGIYTTNTISGPIITTNSASSITATAAILNGSIDGVSAPISAWFEYGTSSAYLMHTAGNKDLNPETNTVKISVNLSGLLPKTTYYFRLVVKSGLVTKQGSVLSFITPETPTTTEIYPTTTETQTASSVSTSNADISSTGTQTAETVIPTTTAETSPTQDQNQTPITTTQTETPETIQPTMTIEQPTSGETTNTQTTVSLEPIKQTTAPEIILSVKPAIASVLEGDKIRFVAAVNGVNNANVKWMIIEKGAGEISADGVYTAPKIAGTFHIKAIYLVDYTKSATAVVSVKSRPVETTTNQTPTPTPLPVVEIKKEETETIPVVAPTIEELFRAPESEKISNIKEIASVASQMQSTTEKSKKEIIELLDKNISRAIESVIPSGKPMAQEDMNRLNNKIGPIKQKILESIDDDLSGFETPLSERVKKTETAIDDGLKNISSILSNEIGGEEIKILERSEDISGKLNDLAENTEDNFKKWKERGGELLFKDTNGDGISDYESIHLYNIDPEKPAPVAVYEGREINAAEKILLGFDPSKTELVKISPEEPKNSIASETPAYKVNNVKLSEEKKVSISGWALPNAFVTLYIYSTPIIVTVQANNDGEWQYMIDKELENGDHTVYAASVDNSGKIVVKSSAVAFVKTAEAATIIPVAPISVSNVKEPELLRYNTIIVMVVIFVSLVLIFLVIVGIMSRRNNNSIK